MPDPPTHKESESWEAVSGVSKAGAPQRLYFGHQFRAGTLIGVQGKDPIVAGSFYRVILLVNVPCPVPVEYLVRIAAANIESPIPAAAVYHYPFIDPRQPF